MDTVDMENGQTPAMLSDTVQIENDQKLDFLRYDPMNKKLETSPATPG